VANYKPNDLKLMKKNSRLVYSTDKGRIASAPDTPARRPVKDHVHLKRESKGRGGKTVTLVTDLPLTSEEIKSLAKELKQVCGTGGTVKDDIIEIQGEHREKLKSCLESKGFKVKISGG